MATKSTVKVVHTCHDDRCTLGITWCAGCNGFGRINPKGKKYRKEINIPKWAVDHEECHGKGMLVCSERNEKSEPLTEDERNTLGLPPVPVRVPRTRKPAAVKADQAA